MCNNCTHKAVCSIYRATGGKKQCEHYKEERKGRWIYEEDTEARWTTKAICSACKCVVEHNIKLSHEYGKEDHVKRNKFCPNCGADMRGGSDD